MSEKNLKLLFKAESLTEIERWQDAIPLLLQFLSLNPQNYHATCLVSLCYFHLDESEFALDYAQKAIAIEPDEEWAHRLRSIILSKLGKNKDSLKSAEEAVRLAPYLSATLQTLVMAYLDSNKPRKARDIANKMVENHPESDESFLSLGLVNLRTNHLYQAEKCFREALRINPTNSLARNNLGVAVLRQENRPTTTFNRNYSNSLLRNQPQSEAMEHFTEAIKLEPNNQLIIQNLKNQFNYSIYVFLIISLIPFGLLSFMVFPGGTVVMGLLAILGLIKLMGETFKRKRTAPPELKIFLKSLKRKTLGEYFQEFKRIATRTIVKNWQPHALALVAVIINYFDAKQRNPNATIGFVQTIAVILMVVSGIWLSIKLSRN